MASIELHERFIGSGYVGSIRTEPALSWADQRALAQTARATAASAIQLGFLNQGVSSIVEQLWRLGISQQLVVDSLVRLEGELGLRLDQQTQVLVTQTEYLARIDHALSTPAKTRAAERIADSGELLRRGRWERALAVAQEAVEGDPNNPAGFRATGWALIGLKRLAAARQSFFECGEAADGDERAQAFRQAARLERALAGPREALALLDCIDDNVSEFERRAADYDRAIYLADVGSMEGAEALLRQAIEFSDRFAWSALHDALLGEHPELLAVVYRHIDRLVAELSRLRNRIEQDVAAATDDLDDTLARGASSKPPWGRAARERLTAQLAAVHERLDAASARHGGSLAGLRCEFEAELVPEASDLRRSAAAWRAELQRGLEDLEREEAQRQREREAVAAQQAAMRPVRDVLQAKVDKEARRVAEEEGGEVSSWTPWIVLAPDVAVRSALVRRPGRRFRPEKRWLITLNDSQDIVVELVR
jgi:tetratricopeptide (TPR) repeat protein